MQDWIHAFALAACTAAIGCAGSEPHCRTGGALEAELSAGETQIATRGEDIEWGPCPPTLPAGCEMAILEGDPKREMLFTARFRTVGRFELGPHWHPQNERVTVLEGRVGVGFGDAIDREAVTWFGPGDYYLNAREAHHFVITDGVSVLQITGIGPWKVNYVHAP